MRVTTRPAEQADIPRILSFIHGLASHVREPDSVESTEDTLREALFPANGQPQVFAHVAEDGGRVVGSAIWYVTFSTWTGEHGIWLEDLFVDSEARGGGYGQELIAALAHVCVERGYPRLDWEVLDFNTSAIGFYENLGATAQDGHIMYRLSGKALNTIALKEPGR